MRLRAAGHTGWLAMLGVVAALAVACGGGNPTPGGSPPATATSNSPGAITVYSGRSESLIGPVLQRFQQETGIEVRVRYADTAELAATLLEEAGRGPADVYIAQDAGALGAVEDAGLFEPLDQGLLDRVPAAYRSAEGNWVGLSGRARVVVYNNQQLSPEDLPASILDFTDPKWRGKIGWAPGNGSFQAFVTALRLTRGEDGAREWLLGIKANEPREYANNTSIVRAAAAGEILAGFVNHYYLHRFLAEEGEGFPARNYYTAPGDVGTLINIAGAGILKSSQAKAAAARLVDYLLSPAAQDYFTQETFEYPMIEGVEARADIPSIRELQPLDIDLSRLEDLQGTLALLRETGVLP